MPRWRDRPAVKDRPTGQKQGQHKGTPAARQRLDRYQAVAAERHPLRPQKDRSSPASNWISAGMDVGTPNDKPESCPTLVGAEGYSRLSDFRRSMLHEARRPPEKSMTASKSMMPSNKMPPLREPALTPRLVRG